MRRTPKMNRALIQVRSSSLLLVGLMVLSIPIFPREAGILLGLAGGALDNSGEFSAPYFFCAGLESVSRVDCACQSERFPLLSFARRV